MKQRSRLLGHVACPLDIARVELARLHSIHVILGCMKARHLTREGVVWGLAALVLPAGMAYVSVCEVVQVST